MLKSRIQLLFYDVLGTFYLVNLPVTVFINLSLPYALDISITFLLVCPINSPSYPSTSSL